ncbi:MAG: site-specific integrase [Flavobacteriia bacterium]|nr:site-specific integrase [Flavobacteriia bacterium]OIP45685.1 MAG: recombinase [Flavobacteriaceae bacterium CG2_30_31_66]PIV97121.1 MAG: recombinase [Flavobacteriaceae bacterium CG17_big_fil_post_rev_8_21_14_2_50_31_13]PIX11425.1 MAG: recombinase [Flavobacteriaceae bacterium CG_4_8_14_3_um_filter_31_8]PIY14840.1 MAG: recombinase [Flavobacteriaceae bacterium CG_4_10_14_3_um_filter_31_253]PIZ09567.1 MAG: recombinase [Flavobacteriaceae bacterium CG_4_10_14_0_8_um_filter_31_99]PJC10115.1 MAG: r
MNTSVSILFYIKRAKVNNLGVCPIYTRVTVNSKRFEFSTNKYINPDKWSSDGSKVKGTNEEARTINSHLDYLKNQVLEAEKKLFKKDISITSENLKNELFGLSEPKRMLIPIFQDHNNKIKELLGKEFAPGTLERYKTSLKHTIEFMQWKYNISDIDITKIDHAFIMDYEFWLRSVRNCANNTAVKYIKNFHKIIKICLANDWLDKNPFANYKSKVKEVERVYLTEAEIQSILEKDFKTERLSLVRDIFLFSCFTGLAYIDVKNLTKSHISLGIDGEKWIFTHRQKTESASKIPILPVTQIIIDKYENHPQCINENKLIPILSNQKMNAYLKEIAGICEIEKELTFHIARHTFATTVTLTNGVPIETVSKMLGHKNLHTTQHYAKVLDRKVSEDMKLLKEKYSNTNFKKSISNL